MKKLFTLLVLFLCFTSLKAQDDGCATNVSPANISTDISPTPYITLQWTQVPGALYYDVYLKAKVPPTTKIGTTASNSFDFMNADYNTIYYWYVVPVTASGAAIGCGINTTIFVTGPPPPTPLNDDCSGATVLSGSVAGTTLGASQSQAGAFCSGFTGSADDDVWYEFTANSTGTVTVKMDGSTDFDGVLEIFNGDCGSLVSVACSDVTQQGGSESIVVNVSAGTTYKVRVYSFDPYLSSRGDFTISATGSALPISLIDFKGEHVGNKNILSWSTATESNNSGFQVESSFNGKDFKNLGFVSSQQKSGNSSSVLNYQFTDSRNIGGNVYYRLVQIDKDGKASYSKIIIIKGGKINSLLINAVYPNPAKDKLNLVISSPGNNNINISIIDLAGKTLQRLALPVVSGGNNINVDVSALAAGTYIIKADCKNGCNTLVSKFVKE